MESNKIKTLFVKQQHDFSGPWASYQYDDGLELTILSAFKGKTSLYELLLFFQADVLTIPTKYGSPWLTPFLQNQEYYEYVSQVTTAYDITQLDLSGYDLIISHDPILAEYLPHIKNTYPHIVTAYILAEHTSWQMHQLGTEYDLYLDHTFEMVDSVVRLPQAVNFSFPRTPQTLRKLFAKQERDSVYYDYRSVNYFVASEQLADESLDKDGYSASTSEVDLFYQNLPQHPLNITRISTKTNTPFMLDLSDPRECITYYENLGKTKYFITIANRVGQAAVDAASSGCIVFGNAQSKIHEKLCHPFTLLENPTHSILMAKLDELHSNLDLQQQVLAHQDSQLTEHFVSRPLNTIRQAIDLKKSLITH